MLPEQHSIALQIDLIQSICQCPGSNTACFNFRPGNLRNEDGIGNESSCIEMQEIAYLRRPLAMVVPIGLTEIIYVQFGVSKRIVIPIAAFEMHISACKPIFGFE
jgi:hypothetical protein